MNLRPDAVDCDLDTMHRDRRPRAPEAKDIWLAPESILKVADFGDLTPIVGPIRATSSLVHQAFEGQPGVFSARRSWHGDRLTQ